MVRAVWILAFPALLEALKTDSTADSTQSEVDKWQQTVQSDKQDVETAIDKMGNAALSFRRAARNDTHATALAKNLVDDARSHASQAAAQGKKRAMNDFAISLSALKNLHTTNSSKMKDAVRDAQHKSEHLDQLQKDEQRDARQRLRQARHAQQDEVRRGYREAREATRNLNRDRNSLTNAQRHAGEKESVYEREEDRNEHFAEGNQDRAKDQHEQALGAIENIFERAEDYLEDEGQKDRQSALHARHQAMESAVTSATTALRQAKEQSDVTELLAQPAVGFSLCAAASLGLLAVLVVRRTRPTPIAKPLFG